MEIIVTVLYAKYTCEDSSKLVLRHAHKHKDGDKHH